MADQNQILFYNGQYQLTNTVSTDDLGPFNSFKTENFALTDALLGVLTNDVIVKQGTRAFEANQSIGNNRITNLAQPINDNDAASKIYVDNLLSGLSDFRESVLSKDITDPPASPADGDRYLIGLTPGAAVATGVWSGRDGDIGTWDQGGGVWIFENDINPFDSGTFVYVEDLGNQYIFNAGTPDPFADGSWSLYNAGVIIGGDGITIDNSTNTASVDILPGGGQGFVGGQLAVDGAALIDGVSITQSGTLGANSLNVNFATAGTWLTANNQAVTAADLAQNGINQGAKGLGFDPTNVNETVATTLQLAVEDAFTLARTSAPGYNVTAGVDVNKGDAVYLTTSDTVAKYPIQSPLGLFPIGLAQGTVTTGATVKVSKSNTKLTNVTTGKTAGQQLFWNNLTDSHEVAAPTTTGYAIVQTGFALNATDIGVDVQLLRING